MNLQFKSSLKAQFIKMLEDLSYEEIAEKLERNELGLKQFRNECIRKEFYDRYGNTSVMDLISELSEKYQVQPRMIRYIIKSNR